MNANLVSLLQIQDATRADDMLQELIQFIVAGWPSTRGDTPENIHPVWNFRDELSVVDGIILKSSQIVIPITLRSQILDQLHYSHLGIEKTRNMAKSTVYWPNINCDDETMIQSCATGQEMLPTKPSNPLIPHKIPTIAWYTLSADVFYLDKLIYLCVVDYYSKLPVVHELKDNSADALIHAFENIFCEYGRCPEIISDVGSNFVSEHFQRFCSKLDIKHVTTSSYHHNSNG